MQANLLDTASQGVQFISELWLQVALYGIYEKIKTDTKASLLR